eukprot:TRINITY_DN100564_c0_g1_i1.p1 TRINITY_DN100564_c0_g1~~TRINITY_DN100564_c0_g1_i1.p1  ORF type:complete len:100 (+),score=27.94 TRINITY_DN100564_c0_g1_i1:107-406(+)
MVSAALRLFALTFLVAHAHSSNQTAVSECGTLLADVTRMNAGSLVQRKVVGSHHEEDGSTVLLGGSSLSGLPNQTARRERALERAEMALEAMRQGKVSL